MAHHKTSGKVLLCSMPFSASSHGLGARYEHQGLCSLSAHLRHRSFSAEIIDCNFTGCSAGEAIEAIAQGNPLIAGFSVFSTNYRETVKGAAILREKGFGGHITLGGHFPTFSYEQVLRDNPAIDSVITGEGEKPLVELAEALREGRVWGAIRGIASRRGDSVAWNGPAPLEDPLDFPFPLDRSAYLPRLKGQNFATVISSRGCTGLCTFCSVKSFYSLCRGKKWRSRSALDVVGELEYLNREHGISSFAFFDDNFIGPGREGRKRASDIASLIISRDLELVFSLECRPDSVDADLFKALREAGLVKVSLGVESFVPRQQALYGKKHDGAATARSIEVLKSLGVHLAIYLIPFDPFVTSPELAMNLTEASHVGAEHFPSFSRFLQVFPGIPLYRSLESHILPSDRLLLRTPYNEYWLGYHFKAPFIDAILSAFLRCEETASFMLGRYAKIHDDSETFLKYREIRRYMLTKFLEVARKGEESQGSITSMAHGLEIETAGILGL
ncbi:MAG: radical SAM protein [Candidatus Eremiobacteraeota bacterium]|nr:radical SAM protein [Candidatus Eremiobacteraeota bacterium]